MKIFVINLKSATFRRTRMQNLLDALECQFEFIDAVIGASLPSDVLTQQKLGLNSKLTKPELGAMLSHISVWKKIVNENIHQALILEDDVHFSHSFKQVLAQVNIPADTVALFRLETMFASVNVAREPHQTIDNIHIHKIFSNHAGSAGYIINKKTAAFLLAQTHLLTEAIDTEMFDPTRSNLNMAEVFQCVPAVIMQDMFLPEAEQNTQLTSAISNNRQDTIEGLIGKESRYLKALKKLVRPIKLKIYSLMLRPKNKTRIVVTFEQ